MELLSKAPIAVTLVLAVSASISAQPQTVTMGNAIPSPGSPASSQNLKKIDQAALQAMVDKTARELLIPGAVVLLRTPQGEFAVTYGTTLLGAKVPPRADTYFRAASYTKTMTAAVILQLAQ
jgi:D-alanyl-D-alanine carboxypeptidase